MDTAKQLCIAENPFKMIKICDSNIHFPISFYNELSTQFEVKSGLKQGGALSVILFNVVLG